MTKENREWMQWALFLGEDQMILFAEDRWKWISEPMDYLTKLEEQCVFYQAYARHGGKDKSYENREALNKAIEYAERKINDAFKEIQKRFKLDEDN
jgi:hypothetical protein|tara:strand:- start:228 stop:515 length:288 start_codon:yes stop_codon:yes gene_type:complete